jgi:hypothetical protein
MMPSATMTLSIGVLTRPVCVLPRDIFCTMSAHQLVPPAPLVISNDNRRKNARQRAVSSDNLTWMQKIGLLGKKSKCPCAAAWYPTLFGNFLGQT